MANTIIREMFFLPLWQRFSPKEKKVRDSVTTAATVIGKFDHERERKGRRVEQLVENLVCE